MQLLEVGVLQGLVHGDAVLGVERKHLPQHQETMSTMMMNDHLQGRVSRLRLVFLYHRVWGGLDAMRRKRGGDIVEI